MIHNLELIKELENKAEVVRRNCLTIFNGSQAGHVGGTFSLIEIITTLYFHHMKLNPRDPFWPERDRLVLSKAHACEALYSALVEIGFISKEKLPTYYRLGSVLQGHADRWCTPGIEFSGGSLGEGLSYAAAIAYSGLRLWKSSFDSGPRVFRKTIPRFRVYCILGDGECDEGQVWEAAMAASSLRLDNLVAIVDYNKFQVDGPSNEVCRLEPFADKWRCFGWYPMEVDGHNLAQLADTLDMTDNMFGDGRPKVIIAHTIKGRGIPYFEERHLHFAGGAAMSRGLKQATEQSKA
jgi:transketolase